MPSNVPAAAGKSAGQNAPAARAGFRDRWQRRWRRWSGPTGRSVALTVMSLLITLADAGSVQSTNRWGWASVTLAAGVVGTVAIWWRRKYPRLFFALGAVLVLAAGATAPLMVAVFSFAIRRRDRTMLILALVAALCLLVPHSPVWTWPDLTNTLAIVFGVLLAVTAGAYVGARRDLLDSLRQRAAEAEAERELRAEQARTSERSRIAREMHDILAHKVSLIALQAGGLEVNAQAKPELVTELAGQIRITAREALEDLRTVLGVLRNPDNDQLELAPQPGVVDLQGLLDASRRAGVQVDLQIRPDDGSLFALPDALGRTVFRIVQEGLTNVYKHARGAATRITVDRGPTIMTVTVANQRPVGAGFLLPGSGSGLIGLAERVGLVGGTLVSAPTADGGWQIRAEIPVPATGWSDTTATSEDH